MNIGTKTSEKSYGRLLCIFSEPVRDAICGSLVFPIKQRILCATVMGALLGASLAGDLRAAEPFQLAIRALDLENVAMNEAEHKAENLMWRRQPPDSAVAPFGSGEKAKPARTTVTIPADGEYYLWANYLVDKSYRRTFFVLLGDEELMFCEEPYGTPEEGHPDSFQGQNPDDRGLLWTSQPVTLRAGDSSLQLTRTSTSGGVARGIAHPPIVRAIVITNNPNAKPSDFSLL